MKKLQKKDWKWVKKQDKLYKLPSGKINSILSQLHTRFSKKPKTLKALSLLRIGTPYQRGCLGENSKKDKDPVFRLDVTDCTAFILTNTALLHSKNLKQAEKRMETVNYRDGKISFEDRLHFTTDRNKVSPYFSPFTNLAVDQKKLIQKRIVLNKKRENGRLIDIDWQKETTIEFIPSKYINQELISSLPETLGVAFINKERFKIGLDVVHEGLLVDNSYLIHASSVKNKVTKTNFLNYYFKNGKPKFDGIVLFKIQ